MNRVQVLARLSAPPFLVAGTGDHLPQSVHLRQVTLVKVMDWLEGSPGLTWQDRWNASGAGADGRLDWRRTALQELGRTGRPIENRQVAQGIGMGLTQLICGDVLRPGVGWLLGAVSPRRLWHEMARTRDGEGFAALAAVTASRMVPYPSASAARERIAIIMAAKGGRMRDITPGDGLELARACDQLFPGSSGGHGVFYQLLHAVGVFPADAPPTVRMFSPRFGGQRSVEQLVDRYDLACRPVRDLLVDYSG